VHKRYGGPLLSAPGDHMILESASKVADFIAAFKRRDFAPVFCEMNPNGQWIWVEKHDRAADCTGESALIEAVMAALKDFES
jgi:hypothetical protein